MDTSKVTFTIEDRCDRCGATCYTKAFQPDGQELQFCLHHVFEYGQTLFDNGWTIVSNQEAIDNIGATVPAFV